MSAGLRAAYALLFDTGVLFARDAVAFELVRARVGAVMIVLSVVAVIAWLAGGPRVDLAVGAVTFPALLVSVRVLSRLGSCSWERREAAFDCFGAAAGLLVRTAEPGGGPRSEPASGGQRIRVVGAGAPDAELPAVAEQIVAEQRGRQFAGGRLLRLLGGGELLVAKSGMEESE